uniref:ARAD1D05302p n=1 Tax=Blastobotrys adeninivorans TaxID=409370 RepID=A0A060T7S7_BLAAD
MFSVIVLLCNSSITSLRPPLTQQMGIPIGTLPLLSLITNSLYLYLLYTRSHGGGLLEVIAALIAILFSYWIGTVIYDYTSMKFSQSGHSTTNITLTQPTIGLYLATLDALLLGILTVLHVPSRGAALLISGSVFGRVLATSQVISNLLVAYFAPSSLC